MIILITLKLVATKKLQQIPTIQLGRSKLGSLFCLIANLSTLFKSTESY